MIQALRSGAVHTALAIAILTSTDGEPAHARLVPSRAHSFNGGIATTQRSRQAIGPFERPLRSPAKSGLRLDYQTSYLWSGASDACYLDDRVYVTFPFGLLVLDADSLGQSGVVHRRFHPAGYGGGIAVRANRAYWAAGERGLRTLDVSDPDEPGLLDSVSMSGFLGGVYFTNDSTHLITTSSFPWWGYLDVWSLADPDAPELVSSVFLPGWPDGIDIDSSLLFLTYSTDYGYSAVWVLDISDPLDPQVVGGLPEGGYSASGLDFEQGYLYVAMGDSGLTTYQLDSAMNPEVVSAYSPGGWINDVFLLGEVGYVSAYGDSVHVVDLSDPLAPSKIATRHWSGRMAVASETRGRMLLVDIWDGVTLVDIEDARSPTVLSRHETAGSSPRVTMSNHSLLAASYPGKLHAVDVSDPASPRIIFHLDSLGDCYRGDMLFPYLYIAGGYEGIIVADLSDSANPHVVRQVDTPGRVFDLQVHNSHLFVANEDEGLQVFSLDEPSTPQWVANAHLNGRAVRVLVQDSIAFVGAGGLHIVNVSNATQPTLVGGYSVEGQYPEGVYEIIPRGEYCFVRRGYDGVDVLDISDLTDPVLLANFGGPGWVAGFELQGDLAFVAIGSYEPTPHWLHIFDLWDPTSPRLVDSLVLPMASGELMALDDSHILVSHQDGQVVYDLSTSFRIGDTNSNGIISSADIIYLVNCVFKGGPGPLPYSRSGDVTCDSDLTAADIIYLVNFAFKNGPNPACP